MKPKPEATARWIFGAAEPFSPDHLALSPPNRGLKRREFSSAISHANTSAWKDVF